MRAVIGVERRLTVLLLVSWLRGLDAVIDWMAISRLESLPASGKDALLGDDLEES